jgi:hypothetical protein
MDKVLDQQLVLRLVLQWGGELDEWLATELAALMVLD